MKPTLNAKTDRFSLTFDGQSVMVTGNLDVANPREWLEPFFAAVHQNLVREKSKEVVINFKAVVYLNSAAIKEIVRWVVMREQAVKGTDYKLVFLCNRNSVVQQGMAESLLWLKKDFLEIR